MAFEVRNDGEIMSAALAQILMNNEYFMTKISSELSNSVMSTSAIQTSSTVLTTPDTLSKSDFSQTNMLTSRTFNNNTQSISIQQSSSLVMWIVVGVVVAVVLLLTLFVVICFHRRQSNEANRASDVTSSVSLPTSSESDTSSNHTYQQLTVVRRHMNQYEFGNIEQQ